MCTSQCGVCIFKTFHACPTHLTITTTIFSCRLFAEEDLQGSCLDGLGLGQGLDFVASRVSDFFLVNHTGHTHREEVRRRRWGIQMTVGSTSKGRGQVEEAACTCFLREHPFLPLLLTADSSLFVFLHGLKTSNSPGIIPASIVTVKVPSFLDEHLPPHCATSHCGTTQHHHGSQSNTT